MTTSVGPAAGSTPLPVHEIAAYTDGLATAIANLGRRDPDSLWTRYRIFASLSASPNIRREALWRAFGAPANSESLVLPASTDARRALAADVLRLSSEPAANPLPAAIAPLLRRLDLDATQIEPLRQWIDWENDLLRRIGRGDATVPSDQYPIELAKRLAAVGIPLSALYFSGSVIGFSAVGITSGLASIGGASGLVALGLNPMTAGIAALILGSIAIKKILDVVSADASRKELERQIDDLTRLRLTAHEYMSADAAALEHGPWWEIFTGRRARRRAIVNSLREAMARQ